MRLPLATDLKARVGTPDKDARVKNGIIEIRGESSVVRQRPGVSEASATALGLLAQGGMVFGDYLVIINGDEAYYFTYDAQTDFWTFSGGYSLITGSSLSEYDPDASYSIDDPVYYQDPDTGEVYPLYPMIDNPPEPPSTTSPYWSRTPAGTNRYQGTATTCAPGPICGSTSAAGYSAFALYPYNSFANRFNNSWKEYAYSTSSNLYVSQWQYDPIGGVINYLGIISFGPIYQVA